MTSWNIGDNASLSKTVTRADIEAFAAVTLDTNPVHLDEAYAAGTIFKGRIAHGMLSAGLISAVIGTKIPGPGAIYRSQTVSFHLPVREGDVITATATITSFEHGVMKLNTTVTNQHGKVVVSGCAEIGYRPEKFKIA
ncbi:MAG TPA: MaoC family dehydratase [Drouetiella sp.]|jgi:3-hydroxybutyryl-CoA dehydratase